ncbi:enoyl-CoA hydratase/isomerase family protein, partial [bacterium AH-315-K03]|nr:enoyl-CoA hydratase/isomerase family protein [bacterium AH-315-K03]
MPQHFETLIYCVKDAVATISLNRPDRLNAINNQMITELITAFDLTDADDDVRVVIVTGAGRAFSAGADLSGGSEALDFEINDDPHSVVERGLVRDGGGRVALRIFSSLKPVIGAINGAAVGAGATIPLAMDIRLASNT